MMDFLTLRFSDDLEESIEEFKEHRREIKKPMTPRAEAKFRKKIHTFLKNFTTKQEIIAAMDHAIEVGYRSFFPKELSEAEKLRRWNQHPELFYDLLTPEERNRLNSI